MKTTRLLLPILFYLIPLIAFGEDNSKVEIAQVEAKATQAEAEVTKAEAEVVKAKAEVVKAEAEVAKANAAQVEAEVTKAEAEVTKAKAAQVDAEVKATKAKADAKVAKDKADVVKAKAAEAEVTKVPVIADAYRSDCNKPPPNSDTQTVSYQNDKQDCRTVGLNDTVVVEITELKTLIDKALCSNKTPNCKPQSINLYLNGKKVAEKGLPDEKTIKFPPLKYDSDRKDLTDNWANLLGSPNIFSGEFFQSSVNLAVGLDDNSVMLELNNKPSFKLRRIDTVKFWICIVVAVLIGIALISPHRFSSIKNAMREALCNFGSKPPDVPKMGTNNQPENDSNGNPIMCPQFKPWSLARCQMAFWFVLVVGSFLSIWVIVGALDTINTSVLALIGTGSVAALGSVMIDGAINTQSELDELRKKTDAINVDILKIDADIETEKLRTPQREKQKEYLTSVKKNTQDKLEAVNNQIIEKSRIPTSQGFWIDILTDQDGSTGFSRIQMVVWTLILGVIFVYSVWQTLSMPEFSPTLLTLQGISAGTYLGFKMPKKES